MENNTHNVANTLTVTREGLLDPDFLPPEPTAIEVAADRLRAFAGHIVNEAVLQVRMATYDAVHGTEYRQIRNTLAREKRNREFEQRIGLIAVRR